MSSPILDTVRDEFHKIRKLADKAIAQLQDGFNIQGCSKKTSAGRVSRAGGPPAWGRVPPAPAGAACAGKRGRNPAGAGGPAPKEIG